MGEVVRDGDRLQRKDALQVVGDLVQRLVQRQPIEGSLLVEVRLRKPMVEIAQLRLHLVCPAAAHRLRANLEAVHESLQPPGESAARPVAQLKRGIAPQADLLRGSALGAEAHIPLHPLMAGRREF